jgi:hypothetical protein
MVEVDHHLDGVRAAGGVVGVAHGERLRDRVVGLADTDGPGVGIVERVAAQVRVVAIDVVALVALVERGARAHRAHTGIDVVAPR